MIKSTERVYFRELQKNDYKLFLELDSDVEVMKYLTDGRVSTEKESKDAVERILKVQVETNHKFGLWFIFQKESNEFIGWILFRPCKDEPSNLNNIEIGYRLKRKIWGKGYATEVSKNFLEYGFNELGVEEVFAITMKENFGSQKVMQKIGLIFKKDYIENIFPGENKNAVHYFITKEMWYQGNTNQR